IKRFGHVIGWLGDLVGGLFVVAGVANYFQLYDRMIGALSGNVHVYDPVVVAQLNYIVSQNADNLDQLNNQQLAGYHWAENAARQSEIEKLLIMVAVGIAIVVIGRSLRYIIAGRH
ncbi:MAG: hypothetical protein WCA43_09675, partial [Bradyrhizobium sp.]